MVYKDADGVEYHQIEVIGRGGFGSVYLVERMTDKKKFAIKTIDDLPNEGSLRSINNEIEMALKVSSDNVVKYLFFHDGKTFENLYPYIIMEYTDMGTLEKLLRENRDSNLMFSNAELKKIFLQLANGMKDIAECNLIHRDIKPCNILIFEDNLKITDFGLAKITDKSTRSNSLKGWRTDKYASPEVWEKRQNTIQMDMYSMGIIFYELATLKYPYEMKKGQEYRDAHLYNTVINAQKINNDLPLDFVILINTMLEKNFSYRYETWGNIIEKINEVNLKDLEIGNNAIEDSILKRSNDILTSIEEEKNKQKLIAEKEDHSLKVIYSTYEGKIYNPVKELIAEILNRDKRTKFSIKKIENSYKDSPFGFELEYLGEKILEVKFEIIEKENFMRKKLRHNSYDPFNYLHSEYGIKRYEEVLCLPTHNDKNILAWGEVHSRTSPIIRGFNIFFIKNEESTYSDLLHVEFTEKKGRCAEYFNFETNRKHSDHGLTLKELNEYSEYLKKATFVFDHTDKIFDSQDLKQFILETLNFFGVRSTKDK